MTDFHDNTAPAKRKKPIHREHILQGRILRFTNHAIDLPSGRYQFSSFDRAGQTGEFTHANEAARGVRRSTLDTLLEIDGFMPIWWEAKDKGEEPSDEQYQMIAKLQSIGRYAGWGDSVEGYRTFLAACGVPLKANAAYQAMVLDGHVASLIAKAETKRDGKPTKARKSKAIQGRLATVARGHRMGVWRPR